MWSDRPRAGRVEEAGVSLEEAGADLASAGVTARWGGGEKTSRNKEGRVRAHTARSSTVARSREWSRARKAWGHCRRTSRKAPIVVRVSVARPTQHKTM